MGTANARVRAVFPEPRSFFLFWHIFQTIVAAHGICTRMCIIRLRAELKLRGGSRFDELWVRLS